MRGSHKARLYGAGIKVNLTPMINMVFLLLVYFLFTLSMKTQEGTLSTETPAGDGQQADVEKQIEEEDEARIRAVPAARGVGLFFRGWPVSGFEDLARQLRDVPPEAVVIVDADPAVTYRDVVRIHNVCLKTGHENVVFTLPPR